MTLWPEEPCMVILVKVYIAPDANVRTESSTVSVNVPVTVVAPSKVLVPAPDIVRL